MSLSTLLGRNVEAVLFDAGGTLVELDFAEIVSIGKKHGFDFAVQALREGEVAARLEIDARARNPGRAQDTNAVRVGGYFSRILLSVGLSEREASAVTADVVDANRESNLWRVAIAGAREALSQLQEHGVRTAVVSNADGRVEATLATLGLVSGLEWVMDSHHEGVEKPDPEIFRRAMNRLDLDPSRAAYVGDIYSIDVVGSRAAGMLPVLLDPFDAFVGSDCLRIGSLAELTP